MRASAFAALISFCLLIAICSLAQDSATPSPLPQTGAVLVKLSPPSYPPLARQARIAGNVKVQLSIRKDGSVESAEVISGHPILKQAALDSATKSQFECRDCGNEVSPYLITYTFGLFDEENDREVISEHPSRAAKCLYLWKCGIARTSTWQCWENHRTEITQSSGHVTILTSPVCVETDSSYEANERLP
jgi:TonB family protein